MVKEGWPFVVRPGEKTAPVITTLGRPFTTIPVCHNKALSSDITQSCIGFFGRTELLAWRSRVQLPLSDTRRDQLPPDVTTQKCCYVAPHHADTIATTAATTVTALLVLTAVAPLQRSLVEHQQ